MRATARDRTVLADESLTTAAKLVYVYLSDCLHGGKSARIARSHIVTGTGLGEKTVRRALSELDDADLITRESADGYAHMVTMTVPAPGATVIPMRKRRTA